MDLKQEGIDVGLAVAGLCGAVLMTSKQSALNLGKTVTSVLGGAASANYITPLVLKVAKLDDTPQYAFAIAFLLGFAGLRAIELISSKIIPTERNEPTDPPKRRR
jgi:hypothetical protein